MELQALSMTSLRRRVEKLGINQARVATEVACGIVKSKVKV